MAEEKDDQRIFPTRTGPAQGAAVEGRMIERAGGAGGVRTVVQTNGDGTTTTLRTRGGMPEFTTTEPDIETIDPEFWFQGTPVSFSAAHGLKRGTDEYEPQTYGEKPLVMATGRRMFSGRKNLDKRRKYIGNANWFDTTPGSTMRKVVTWKGLDSNGVMGCMVKESRSTTGQPTYYDYHHAAGSLSWFYPVDVTNNEWMPHDNYVDYNSATVDTKNVIALDGEIVAKVPVPYRIVCAGMTPDKKLRAIITNGISKLTGYDGTTYFNYYVTGSLKLIEKGGAGPFDVDGWSTVGTVTLPSGSVGVALLQAPTFNSSCTIAAGIAVRLKETDFDFPTSDDYIFTIDFESSTVSEVGPAKTKRIAASTPGNPAVWSRYTIYTVLAVGYIGDTLEKLELIDDQSTSAQSNGSSGTSVWTRYYTMLGFKMGWKETKTLSSSVWTQTDYYDTGIGAIVGFDLRTGFVAHLPASNANYQGTFDLEAVSGEFTLPVDGPDIWSDQTTNLHRFATGINYSVGNSIHKSLFLTTCLSRKGVKHAVYMIPSSDLTNGKEPAYDAAVCRHVMSDAVDGSIEKNLNNFLPNEITGGTDRLKILTSPIFFKRI